jgi:hypothetical protein
MATTEAATIRGVVGRTAVAYLVHVIGEHAMAWLCLIATDTTLNGLASTTRTSNHQLTPCPILRGAPDE